MKCNYRLWMAVGTLLAVAACSNGGSTGTGGEDAGGTGDVKGNVSVNVYETVALGLPEGVNATEVEWKVDTAASPLYSLGRQGDEILFLAGVAGKYKVSLTGAGKTAETEVTVNETDKTVTPYLKEVYDYVPGVGQFVNVLPEYESGNTQEDMNRKCREAIADGKNGMISLGGFGGYVVFGFDHTVINVEGKRDIRILGNAFQSAANPNPGAPYGGSVEPGVVMVAYDRNKNGKPDEDEWYEIWGSSHIDETKELWYQMAVDNGNDVKLIRDYAITYHRPETEDPVAGSGPNVSVREYAYWEDNQGNSGYKVKNTFHRQSYYPQWLKEDSYTLRGTRLPENGIDESGAGNYYVLYGYRYGYADNYPNKNDESAIDISWARDKEGKPVCLPGVDFVKVYSGVNQENGWIGENSTEVCGAVDLHVEGTDIATREQD